ncbi:MAG: Gfo/Idh/MocA family oxidoreductase [Gemmataceae bacterium]|nr:Gfo/Idh/MocA family oxidoreductase [Gemmataceae bacterium]
MSCGRWTRAKAAVYKENFGPAAPAKGGKAMAKGTTRRGFLATTGAAAALAPHVAWGQNAPPRDTLRVGLIGCGSRGTGAATQALKADPNVRLVAMADVFRDRLDSSLERLHNDRSLADKLDVPEARRFVGFDAYQRLIDCGVDVVLLCTPPGFRPLHLQAAVEANKHIFAEKPIAVDAPGVRRVERYCEEARRKNLSVVSGLCLRYSNMYKEAIRRIHAGAIGNIVAVQAQDLRGRIWMFPRQRHWTDMEWQLRNWYYFTWLSGDFNVEQHIHNLDVAAWVMGNQYPIRAVGMGGRQVRTGPEYGHIYDHFSVVYEYANGVKLFSNTRQQERCAGEIAVHVLGSLGRANLNERQIVLTGPNAWRQTERDNDFYQTEHDELFASIRNGRPINNGDYMCKSTLLAIMGRMAAYTGQVITWEQAYHSREDLTPARYEWGPMPTPPVAQPGAAAGRS